MAEKIICSTHRISMPDKLTAENGAKALLIGEFFEEVEITCGHCDNEGCEECGYRGTYIMMVPVSWDTIKRIYDKVVESYGNSLAG